MSLYCSNACYILLEYEFFFLLWTTLNLKRKITHVAQRSTDRLAAKCKKPPLMNHSDLVYQPSTFYSLLLMLSNNQQDTCPPMKAIWASASRPRRSDMQLCVAEGRPYTALRIILLNLPASTVLETVVQLY